MRDNRKYLLTKGIELLPFVDVDYNIVDDDNLAVELDASVGEDAFNVSTRSFIRDRLIYRGGLEWLREYREKLGDYATIVDIETMEKKDIKWDKLLDYNIINIMAGKPSLCDIIYINAFGNRTSHIDYWLYIIKEYRKDKQSIYDIIVVNNKTADKNCEKITSVT